MTGYVVTVVGTEWRYSIDSRMSVPVLTERWKVGSPDAANDGPVAVASDQRG